MCNHTSARVDWANDDFHIDWQSTSRLVEPPRPGKLAELIVISPISSSSVAASWMRLYSPISCFSWGPISSRNWIFCEKASKFLEHVKVDWKSIRKAHKFSLTSVNDDMSRLSSGIPHWPDQMYHGWFRTADEPIGRMTKSIQDVWLLFSCCALKMTRTVGLEKKLTPPRKNWLFSQQFHTNCAAVSPSTTRLFTMLPSNAIDYAWLLV